MWLKQLTALDRIALIALILPFTLAACDFAEEDLVPAFSVAVSGDISTSFIGIPVADRGSFELPSGESVVNYDFYFRGADSVYSASVSLHLLNGTLQVQSYTIMPTPGEIPPGSASASFGIREAPNHFRGFRNQGGTLTITRVSEDQVEGRFEFSASDDDPSQEVEIVGEFKAELTERDE